MKEREKRVWLFLPFLTHICLAVCQFVSHEKCVGLMPSCDVIQQRKLKAEDWVSVPESGGKKNEDIVKERRTDEKKMEEGGGWGRGKKTETSSSGTLGEYVVIVFS